MGKETHKSAAHPSDANFTPVNGLAIAAQIARALPAPLRRQILARMAEQAPMVAAALESSIQKISVPATAQQLKDMADSIREQMNTPDVRTPPARATAKPQQVTRFTEAKTQESTELSPAEQLLAVREGTHSDLDRELEKQKPASGRRRIISA